MRRARLPLALVVAVLPLVATAKPAPKKKAPAHKPAPAAASSTAAPASTAGSDSADDAPGGGDSVMAASDATAEPDAGPPRSAPVKALPPPPKASPPAAAENAPPAEPKETPPAAPSIDLQRLRADYDRLRDELYRARARAQIVQEGLYASKLGATVRWKGAPDYVIRRAELRLDGASLWDSGDKPVTDGVIKVAERAVKPGPHALTVRLEIRIAAMAKAQKVAGKDADQMGYTSEHTFAIVVPDGKRTMVAITGDEDGDPPEYEPEIEVELETEK